MVVRAVGIMLLGVMAGVAPGQGVSGGNSVAVGGATTSAAAPMATATLTGRLVDDTGKPVADEQVKWYVFTPPANGAGPTLNGRKMIQPVQQLGGKPTDENGVFSQKGLPATGEILVSVDVEGFAQINRTLTLPQDNLELKLEKPFTKVSGRVLKLDDGSPVAGAKVTLTAQRPIRFYPGEGEPPREMWGVGNPLRVTTDGNGFYHTDRLDEGPFMVNAISGDGTLMAAPLPRALYTTATVTRSAPVTLPDIALYPGYTLMGQVKDAETKQPLAGAKVGFMMRGSLMGGREIEPVVTDSEGRYRLAGVWPFPGLVPDGPALSFRFLEAKLDGYKRGQKSPVMAAFDPAHLEVTQDFELEKE